LHKLIIKDLALNLRLKILFVTLIIGSQACFSQVFQQQCNPDTFEVDTTGNEINWEQFPDFSLPFTVVYHGDAPSDSLLHPLHKGFSHIGGAGIDYTDTVWPDQRVYTWTNIANANGWAAATNQPWRMIKSPWENDIDGYREQWAQHLNDIWNNRYKFNPPNEVKEFDIVIADIEWAFHNDDDILSIKYNPLVPLYYQELSNSAFIAEYKIAMAEMYAQPLQLARDILHPDVILSTYNETPIRRTWTLIDDYTWTDWISDSSLVDYLMNDSSGFMNSHFYQLNDIIAPSCYYYHNVDSLSAGFKYLASNLFNLEVNRAWSSKEQLVYVWLNYHPCCSNMEAIKPWMAEATAIFPFMDGVKGLYPWIPVSYDVYEYFIYGLYRLSAFSYMFDGNQTYVIPEPAHSSFVNQTPIWRGVVNGDEILIAAHNPYPNTNDPIDTTYINVAYSNWSETIGVVGKETFLCKFDMNISDVNQVKSLNESVNLFPNPSHNNVSIEGNILNCTLSVYEPYGRIVRQIHNVNLPINLNVSNLNKGVYILIIESKNHSGLIIKKLVRS